MIFPPLSRTDRDTCSSFPLPLPPPSAALAEHRITRIHERVAAPDVGLGLRPVGKVGVTAGLIVLHLRLSSTTRPSMSVKVSVQGLVSFHFWRITV